MALFFLTLLLFLLLAGTSWFLYHSLWNWLTARSSDRQRHQLELLKASHIWTMATILYAGFFALLFFIVGISAAIYLLHGPLEEAGRALFLYSPVLVLLSVGGYLSLSLVVSQLIRK